jgi:hypothetical protein
VALPQSLGRVATSLVLIVTIIAVTVPGRGQVLDPIPPPLSHAKAVFFQNNPEARSQFMAQLPRRPAGLPAAAQALTPAAPPAFGGTWQTATAAPANGLCNPLLLTDGTVIVHVCDSSFWYKLTPDNTGSYVNGTWSQIASLPSGYQPQYHASAVLPDGRVIIMGGEYNGGNTEVWTNRGAIYDPVANTWTAVTPPNGGAGGWSQIGDAAGVVLPNGTFMLGACCAFPSLDALFNPTTLSWTASGAPTTYQNEQGYTLLPTGKVLAIDVWDPPAAQQYDPATGLWSAVASTPISLIDPTACGNYEVGPALLRPDGTVVAFGGNTGCVSGQTADPTAIFNTSAGTWSQGPNVPAIAGASYDLADAPAALLPNGNILFAASPGYGNSPTHFFEFTGANAINQVNDTVFFASSSGAFYYNFLVLPSGQVLATDFSSTVEIYTPSGTYQSSWQPVISSIASTLVPGSSYLISGTQFNGLSQGAAYGDDVQAATNYPIVQISNNATHHVFYARTFGHSTMSVALNAASSTNVTVPANIELGASSLVVIANGIPSQPVAVNISNTVQEALTVNETGSGTVTSSPAAISCPTTCSANLNVGTVENLTATPASGWSFSGWGGACSGTGSCGVTMNSPQTVSATFTQLPTLQVTGPASIFASGTQGGPFSPSSFNYTVAASSGSLGYSVSGVPNWLTASPTSGTATTTAAALTFSVNASANSLTASTYKATITVTNTSNGQGNASLSATLTVTTLSPPPPSTRTFVSGTGSDTNPCTLTAPCLTFAGAISKTAAGGEIDALDPGGFGAVTINKAITIDGGAGLASVLVSGTNAIVVQAGANDVVTIRNLSIDGLVGTGSGGLQGIRFTSGASLNLERVNVMGFAGDGIEFAPSGVSKLTVADTIATNNAGVGIRIDPQSGGSAKVLVARMISNGNGGGLRADGTAAGAGAIVASVTKSEFSGNSLDGVTAVSGPGAVLVQLNQVSISHNIGNGISASSAAGSSASVLVGASTIFGNARAANATSGGTIFPYGNNQVSGNGVDGTFSSGGPGLK